MSEARPRVSHTRRATEGRSAYDGGLVTDTFHSSAASTVHAYPGELADFVRKQWVDLDPSSATPPQGTKCELPKSDVLERLVSTAYQATLLREEERPVTFRLIVGPPSSFPETSGPPNGLHRLVFGRPRPFDEHELRRLAPAAKYHRALIGVEAVGREPGEELRIWGLLQSGPRWLEAVYGGRRALPTLPTNKLIIRGTAPGRIAVASGSITIGEIRGGKIMAPANDVFDSNWLPEFFARERNELLALHAQERARARGRWADLDPAMPGILSQQMVKRIIATIRAARHGGMLVILPNERVPDVVESVLRAKYLFDDAEPRRRFRSLMVSVMRVLAESGTPNERTGKVGWSAYGASNSTALTMLDEAIFELSHLVAALADVDGAVIMTKRFELIGFGAEIAGELPDVRSVFRADDLEGTSRHEESVEGVGTRHRAAYRLCSRVEDALVVVISQDGNVRFVRSLDGAVTFWDHMSAGSPEG
jgi:hypothetical protein